MAENIEQRAHEIVEELRADIDFELDDVISRIVRALPEDYYTTLSRQDQLRQLKALLAMGVCNLKEEIMLRSDDGRHIAIVARKNFPGLLANILKRLPTELELVGAKIFTSTDHDFIIDLFEFKPEKADDNASPIESYEIEDTIEAVATSTGRPLEQVREFVSHYDHSNQVLRSPEDIAEHFLAYQGTEKSNETTVRWIDLPEDNRTRVTISSGRMHARNVFQKTAEFLAKRTLDIEQAHLHEIPINPDARIAIASFVVSSENHVDCQTNTLPQAAAELAEYL